MSEPDKPRPVSGEIMAGGQTPPRQPSERAAFSDAEFETVHGTGQERQPRFAEPLAPAHGFDTLRSGAGLMPAPTSERAGPLFWAFGLALAAGAFWISGGHAFVRQIAFPLPVDNAQPLRISQVESRVESRDGRDILFVEGRAENRGDGSMRLPPIEISVTESDGRATRYFLGTNDTELKPGESYTFSSRLEAPRNGVKSVSVSFQEGR